MFNLSLTPFSAITILDIWLLGRPRQARQPTRTMRHGLDFCSLAHRLVMLKTTLGVDEVRRKNSVDQGTLAESSLA